MLLRLVTIPYSMGLNEPNDRFKRIPRLGNWPSKSASDPIGRAAQRVTEFAAHQSAFLDATYLASRS